MYSFKVNGIDVKTEKNVSLLRFLRDDLHLTSIKDGCSEGACGACTVLINGENVRACTVTTEDVTNKDVISVEGLSEREREVYTYSFGEVGAVQCGFCIPGMIMSAKGLLDKNNNPSEGEIRNAIRYNLCRCTGYVKIVKAIKLAGKMFRDNTPIPEDESNWRIGSKVHRTDVKEKVLGTGKYADDYYFPNMVHAVAVRSKYPRAKVLKIDTSPALNVEGVIKVLTWKDVPGNKTVGHIVKDWEAFIAEGEITNFLGDVIALVVGENREASEEGAKKVKVEYEVLKPITSIEEAKEDNAPLVHEKYKGNIAQERHVSRGEAEKAIKGSKYTYTGHFHTPCTEHAFLEPECAVAVKENDYIKVYTSDQGVYDTLHETLPFLNISEEKIKIQNALVGGGFGGKEDVTVQHYAALVTLLTGRPCKMKLSRKESILFHPKRHPMDMSFTIGCDKKGIIQGVKATVYADTGAYQSLCGPVLERACTHASGPYNYQNFEIDGYAYYTNNPPSGAFRGFGVTQTCFAIESCINRLADKVGISPWEMRMRNAIKPGETLPNGQIADNYTGLVETLMSVKDEYMNAKHVGIACAMKNAGVGVGLPDYGRVRLIIKNGKVEIHSAGSCIGQGLWTVLKQIVCTTTSLKGEDVIVLPSSTSDPDSGTTSGSRHTTVTGEACKRASEKLRDALKEKKLNELEGDEFYAEYLAKTDPLGTPVPHPVSHVAYGFATQVCILDEKTKKIKKIIASHDVGKAINKSAVEGQIEGGVVMSLGFALREKYRLDGCKPLEKYGSLGLFRANEVPEIEAKIIEKDGLNISYGAIGLGEITSIPTAPAISDAYYRLDGIERNSLPIVSTPYEYKRKEGISLKTKTKRLSLTGNECIGCKECVRTCAMSFTKTINSSNARLKIERNENTFKPKICIQCGRCAQSCPENAIKQNALGVYIVDKKLCNGCGKCITSCPMKVIRISNEGYADKCISCALCVSSCPMEVLTIAEGK